MQTQTQIDHQRPMMMVREIAALDHAGNMPRRRKAQTAIVVLVFAFAILAFEAPKTSAQSVATKSCPPLSQGFWKNHAPAWKVTSLTLGTKNYTQAQLLAIVETPPSGDSSLILAHQLIAAKLNIAVMDTDPSKVAATIKDADALLGEGPIPEGVRASSIIGQQMVNEAAILDSFNNGLVTQACLLVPPATSSGSTGIIPGVVNGQLADKAYVPLSSFGRVAVINIDSTTPAALIKSISMPLGYHPNATAADPVTQQVVVISYTSPDVQIIDGSQDVFVGTVTSPVTRFAGFSGGACMICGALIDASTNSAILDTAQGYLLLNLATRQFSSFLSGTVAGENFAFNPNTRIVLNPTYSQGVPSGLQVVSLTGPVFTYSTFVGATPDSAAIDVNTNVAVVPDEGTSNQVLINMAEATFDSQSSPPRFSAPSSVFTFPLTSCRNDWTMLSVESSTHLLFLASEFNNCAAVESLPTSIVSGAPPTSPAFQWSHMPSPDAVPWNNSGDPHGIAVFTSIVDGKPYGFLVRSDQAWVARIDLRGMKNAPLVVGGLPGQVDIAPFVFFLSTE